MRFFTKINSKPNRGFTIIELVVVFSVIAILSSVGIAASINYSRAQTLQTATLDLINTLNQAKSYAQSQYKPDDCNTQDLQYYRFDIISSGEDPYYTLNVFCGANSYELLNNKLPKDVDIDSANTTSTYFEFPILKGGIEGDPGSSSPWRIRLISIDGRYKTISVYSSGIIQ